MSSAADLLSAVSGDLAESRRQLEQVQAVAHIGSWTWDRATDCVSFSDEQCRLYGIEPQSRQVDLDAFLALIHPVDRGAMRSAVGRAFRRGKSFVVEHRLAAEVNGTRWIEARCEVVIAGGDVMRMVGTCYDVTERKRYEQSLEQSLAAVRASRIRIVEAADSARRQLERDLHDGAQQRLVTLSLGLRLLSARLGPEARPEVAAQLEAVTQELQLALAELRDLARGIHPAVLTEQGLGRALESLVLRSPLPARIVLSPERRLPAAIEIGVYYLVAEALTNAIKHANASEVIVSVLDEPGTVTVTVRDDGGGGAAVASGHGLRSLADRVASLDGRIRLDSPAGGGTTVIAEIPCA